MTLLAVSRRYVGELISDSEADVREEDSYLFDLDNKVTLRAQRPEWTAQRAVGPDGAWATWTQQEGACRAFSPTQGPLCSARLPAVLQGEPPCGSQGLQSPALLAAGRSVELSGENCL